jgi:hypothetical protein
MVSKPVAVSTLARWLSVGELGVGEKRLVDGIVGKAPNIAARRSSPGSRQRNLQASASRRGRAAARPLFGVDFCRSTSFPHGWQFALLFSSAFCFEILRFLQVLCQSSASCPSTNFRAAVVGAASSDKFTSSPENMRPKGKLYNPTFPHPRAELLFHLALCGASTRFIVAYTLN